MFGYVEAQPKLLSEEQLSRYRGCYCGLCHALRERHGSMARMTLTYDMTFLILVLSSMYEPEERAGEEKCPAHPFKAQHYWRNEISDYAADMNMALAYLNCRDDWKDDFSLTALAEARLMKASYDRVCASYPRQCKVIEESIAELSRIEESREEDPDGASRCFGRLMAELFAYKEDYWSDSLRAMGMALGQFIYIMDACIDLRDDKRYYKYNPMLSLFNRVDEEKRFREILEMLMGECVFHFERLPLVQDADLIRNILCFGVWNKFNAHYNIKGAPDGTGSL